ncbi:XRE family transcriptional regulator [Phenylobacterium sp.]|uniref:helix-turn-helix domain-containing protein n=1 Tax=Phenylobacterium sp. TaxID=1871053 RepID=UPI0019900599|nr:XRE family transcriptional regulator [Phenylobacterium sp.]MBC7168085.1 helix-turn-helix transcriptional regulator [Phenylobacterium sp.]
MDTIIDDTGERLAARIRLERESRGWSLAEAADRAGVAKATISKIERQEISPTAVTLVRLASAFGLTLAGLLVRAESDAGGLQRAADQPIWRDPATGYVRQQVFTRPDHPVELVRVELPPGREVRMPASSYAQIRQVLWVISGELSLTEGAARRELRAGDALGFGPPSDVVFENVSTSPCIYLVALARS